MVVSFHLIRCYASAGDARGGRFGKNGGRRGNTPMPLPLLAIRIFELVTCPQLSFT
jgi:hypothetical protein